jgi:hypothetical protein
MHSEIQSVVAAGIVTSRPFREGLKPVDNDFRKQNLSQVPAEVPLSQWDLAKMGATRERNIIHRTGDKVYALSRPDLPMTTQVNDAARFFAVERAGLLINFFLALQICPADVGTDLMRRIVDWKG